MSIPISIIHPTRCLESALKVKKEWLKKAKNIFQLEYLIVVDSEQYPNVIPSGLLEHYSNLGIVVADSHCSVEANNAGAKESVGDLLIMFQDDITITPELIPDGWDLMLLSKLPEGWREKELAVWIGCGIHNPDGSSLCGHHCITRKYYERLGYFLHPAYKHTHADDAISYKARHDNVVLDLRREIIWKHERCRTPELTEVTATTVNRKTNGIDWYTVGHRTFHEYHKQLIDRGLDLPLDFKLPE